ncbi:hypothetical protein AX15_005792 [Amanita polypyramis BW_CC]|nr:hypothetical protein AX15_005792 [Amanita polypyramis BW_CC]
MADASVHLSGVLDENGAAFYPDVVLPPTANHSEIAPWMDQSPSPSPKPSRFGFTSKSSFVSLRQSTSSTSSRHQRLPEIRMIDPRWPSADDPDYSISLNSYDNPLGVAEPRKLKSSLNVFSRLKNRSKSRIPADSTDSIQTPIPPLPDHYATASVSRITLSPSLSTIDSREKREKKENKLAKKLRSVASTPKASKNPPPQSSELMLDTNLDRMEGIVDPTYAASDALPNFYPNSSSSVFDSSSQSHSYSDNNPYPYFAPSSRISSTEFSNPFSPGSSTDLRKPVLPPGDYHKVSPKTLLPPLHYGASQRQLSPNVPESPSWTPPQSWAVHRDGVDREEGDYTSSDESDAGRKKTAGGQVKPHRSKRQKSSLSKTFCPPAKADQPCKLRIYRANGSYHVLSTSCAIEVSSLLPALKDKLLRPSERETFRLYLREHSRERILGPHERPIEIVRRLLEQAGYEPDDSSQIVSNENLNFLAKFIYKSQRLGPAEDDFSFEKPDVIDLTDHGLRAVPVKLHQAADQIIRLVLSCNPMLEIPLDFIQSCTSLRDLHLSNMSIKRVPQSVRYATSLMRLDLSINRITDLSEAFLDNIPGLHTLNLRSNRLQSLPWYFERINNLTFLDLANNQLKKFPLVLTSMETLSFLDLSFNELEELPNDISRLRALSELRVAGNKITRLPSTLADLRHLRTLDCQRNRIVDLNVMCQLSSVISVYASYNSVSSLDLSFGTSLTYLDVSHNDITQLSSCQRPPLGLIELNLSHAKLSSIEDTTLGSLVSLRHLCLNHNTFTSLPESLGKLQELTRLICSDNKLTALPRSIGSLGKLKVLDAHNNSLTELPVSIWNCGSLETLNLTSNLLGNWHDPPVVREVDEDPRYSRKGSVMSLTSVSVLPPLARSLKRLYLGENRLIDEVLHVFMLFKELRILNISFNELQDMPANFFTNLSLLEELYLSGNKLASLPTEDLPKLQRLKRLYLNGNKLQTLPHELGKVINLTVLDVGSNQLRYNINNWEFDWNWNFNKNLKYLNLSGNKRLQIKSDVALKAANGHHTRDPAMLKLQSLAGFTDLTQLRVLGLMDVTMTTTGNLWMDIPDENDDRRVRTSSSIVGGMAYGIADALGRNNHLNVIDLAHEFRNKPGDAIFAMFCLAQQSKPIASELNPNYIAKYLRDRFVTIFQSLLNRLNKTKDSIPDALRRTFLKLNQDLYDTLYTGVHHGRRMSHVSESSTAGHNNPYMKNGVVGIALYFLDKTLYVANVGDALAVVSRQGSAILSSRKHAPFDSLEVERIRAADGWVSSSGKVNDDADTSRAFGFYNHVPIINARPEVTAVDLTLADEFVIVANRSLWDYVSYQTAVDIARTEPDPTAASQKLRDLAMSYGAEGSIMIMVIAVSDLFGGEMKRKNTSEQADPTFNIPRKVKGGILDRDIARLDGEVPAPTGHLALVFTDIRNSTHLWEVNPGMPTAMRLHNNLLRRQLRLCGGYEVKTEGDAFMCSFPTALAAVWWCLTVQDQLLHESWPLEILECEDGKSQWDSEGRLIARGLSVRMGIHCGAPVCERDPITNRMDYFGPMVNRSARISGNAQGGHVMCSADVIREINASVLDLDPDTEYSRWQPQAAIDAIKRMGVFMKQVGEVKLKGLEVPELLTLIYPGHLQGRAEEKPPAPPTASTSRVKLDWEQVRDLGMSCLRLEALSASRIYKATLPPPATSECKKVEEKAKAEQKVEEKEEVKEKQKNKKDEEEEERSRAETYLVVDPALVLPNANDKSTDEQLMMILDVLSIRIENASRVMAQKLMPPKLMPPSEQETDLRDQLQDALARRGGINERTLLVLLDALEAMGPE